MLINLLKFFHVLIALSLFGITIFCLLKVNSKKFSLATAKQIDTITYYNKIILFLAGLALLTGTFLVYPKNFTFHTPWIQAAYILVGLFSLAIASLILLRKKQHNKWLWRISYFSLIVLIILVIHDAVTKTTFLVM